MMKFDFGSFLFFILLFVPLLLGLIILLFKFRTSKKLLVIEIGFLLLVSAGLGWMGEWEIDTAVSFMGELVTFSISTTGVLLYWVSLVVLLILVLKFSENQRGAVTRFQSILLNFSISFGFMALMSGQFMIRYIALDMVGLLAALSVLNDYSKSRTFRNFIIIFQILRLGDLSLLASILLINHYAGTLDISQMISTAIEMPVGPRIWVFLGFIFATLIKLAIWPFGIWLRKVKDSVDEVVFWISGVLMPVLGFYLLYRIVPIIQSTALFKNITLILCGLILSLILFAHLFKLIKYDRFQDLSSILGCFLLAAAAFTGGNYLGYYLMGLILYRLVLLLQVKRGTQTWRGLSLIFPILLNGAFIWFNLADTPGFFSLGWIFLTIFIVLWDMRMLSRDELSMKMEESSKGVSVEEISMSGVLGKAARWLNRTLEVDFLSRWFSQLSDFFSNLASWLHENVEQGFERVWTWIGKELLAVSEDTLYVLEVDAHEKTSELVEDALKSLVVYERNVLKKTLRWDLVLIPVFLGVILILLLIF